MTNDTNPKRVGMGIWLLLLALSAAVTVRFLPESLGIPETARTLCDKAAIPFLLGISCIVGGKHDRASAAAAEQPSLRTGAGRMIVGGMLILLGITAAAKIALG